MSVTVLASLVLFHASIAPQPVLAVNASEVTCCTVHWYAFLMPHTVPMTSTRWMESTASRSRNVLLIIIRTARRECARLLARPKSMSIRRLKLAFIVADRINMLGLEWSARTTLSHRVRLWLWELFHSSSRLCSIWWLVSMSLRFGWTPILRFIHWLRPRDCWLLILSFLTLFRPVIRRPYSYVLLQCRVQLPWDCRLIIWCLVQVDTLFKHQM